MIMPEKEMTLRQAYIVIDRLNTDGRIEVDRDELRAAIRVIKGALRKQIPTKIRPFFGGGVECPECGTTIDTIDEYFCFNCGQALDWT